MSDEQPTLATATQQLEALIQAGLAAEAAMRLGKRAQVALDVLRDDVTPGTPPLPGNGAPDTGAYLCEACGVHMKATEQYRHQLFCSAKQAAKGLP